MFSQLFHVVLYQPIFNIFVGLYNFIPGHDVGVVILVMTILIRLLVYPLTNSSIKAQKSLQELQPKMEELKNTYKDDKQKQSQALMELYKTHKVNPFASCLPLLVQLPILIALYMVLRGVLTSQNLADQLYSFIANPVTINSVSFGFINMAKANWVLAFLAGAAQYWQAKMTMAKQAPVAAGAGAKDENMMAMMNKQMIYMMPIMTILIGFSLPAGLTLYWFFSTLLMGLQQMWLFKKAPASISVIEGEIVKK
ncbi:MAG: YidC/Oxa1 family membrane protein insertase [Candidatus Magasanikbacteria bacterium]